MSTKTLLFAAALLIWIASLHALPRLGCMCVQTIDRPISLNFVRKIEQRLPSGSCRRIEIRMTMRNKRVICANPSDKWVQDMLLEVQKKNTNESQLSTSQL
ncbi:C-X-C motif chemokine 13 [Periophthalmus magnuspinnatus]|uniref:C-X-C motif chemokine 13 n=1 Tax=Periophthalmus magnuspinnatus TaxID=409849 RepID=UPI00145A6B10|nr:C-X-C motif chemokine 13 [Periophthalmus magnuspinnatus]